MTRTVLRWSAVAGLLAALGVAAPASPAPTGDASTRLRPAGVATGTVRLPRCTPGPASSRPPTAPAGTTSPRACRTDTPIPESGTRGTESTEKVSGYQHLGAGTAGEWTGVSGRLSVVDAAVRRRTFDFVAGRFMVKRDTGDGTVNWLEAGWAETGWAGAGRPRVYTFHTNTRTWQFYDQYPVRPGDHLWFDVHTDGNGRWQAWLWWSNRWHLLTEQRLPLGATAQVEQYVEVHMDARRPARPAVPPVTVDNVRLRAVGGTARFWRDDVPTLTGAEGRVGGGMCLDWITRYDTWTAGTCPVVALAGRRPGRSVTR